MTAPKPQAQPRGVGSERTIHSSRPVAGLLDIEPDLARFLSEEQRASAERFALPLAIAERDDDVEALIHDAGAFGALVLDGLLVQAVTVDTQTTLRLIGSGGVAPVAGQSKSVPPQTACVAAAARTELVLLGDEFLIASHRWPWLVSSLHDRMMEQSESLMTQLAISQLPRVEDRLMAMMWLLADRWGRVTPAGVRLSLSLSHETLGGLIGARRPTVTLAIQKLTQRNALIRHDHEWLIIGQPAEPVASALQLPALPPEHDSRSPWTKQETSRQDSERWRVSVEETTRVREECTRNREQAGRLGLRSIELRGQSRELKQASQAVRRANGVVRDAGGQRDADAAPKAFSRADPRLPTRRSQGRSPIAA